MSDSNSRKRSNSSEQDPQTPSKSARQSSNEREAKSSQGTPESNEIHIASQTSALSNTLHGTSYQAKLLTLCVVRSHVNKTDCELWTELQDFGQFDDICLQYNNNGSKSYRCIQAKHTQTPDTEQHKITLQNLYKNKEHDFFLPKYFTSFQKVVRRFGLENIEDVVVFTNKNLDIQELSPKEVNTLTQKDLNFDFSGEFDAKRYKFVVTEKSELYKCMSFRSDSYLLAEKLLDCIYNKEKLTLNSEYLKKYHIPLMREVLCKRGKKAQFQETFISGKTLDEEKLETLSKKALNLYEALETLNMRDHKRKKSLEEILNAEISISEAFGKAPCISGIDEFVNKFFDFIVKADKLVVKVNREPGKKEKKSGLIRDNIDKLAGHVLVEKDNKIRFISSFKETTNLPGNLGDFRDKLMRLLDEKGIQNIEDLTFEINKFDTCEEGALLTEMSLPYDFIGHTDIMKFFEKFTFAVNQPNETRLETIIEKELGDYLELADSKLAYNTIFQYVFDWMKSTKGTRIKQSDVIFFKVKQMLSSMKLIGLSETWFNRLNKHGIKFEPSKIDSILKKIYSFLDSDKQVLLYSTKCLTLSSLKVHAIIKTREEYSKSGSFAFVDWDVLIDSEKIIDEASTQEDLGLLVFCDTNHSNLTTDNYSFISIKVEELAKDLNKKVILVGCNIIKLSLPATLVTENLNDMTRLSDLSSPTIKDFKIDNFQGKDVSLRSIVNLQPDEWNALIDEKTLEELCSGGKINIGGQLPDLGDWKNCYIPREIRSRELTQENFCKISKGVFAISGIDKVELTTKIIKNNSSDTLVTKSLNKIKKGIRYVLIKDEKDFQKLKEKNKSRIIHHVSWERDYFLHHQSSKDLKEYTTSYSEDEFASQACQFVLEDENTVQNRQKKIVIISDTPGMGKSVFLTKLAIILKKKHPEMWLLRVNLNDFAEFGKDKFSPDKLDASLAVDYLINNLLGFSSVFEKELLRYCFNRKEAKIILMFDGYDETIEDYRQAILTFLKTLEKQSGVQKIFVTSRPDLAQELKKHLEGLTNEYHIQPFTEEHQKEFLRLFWKQKDWFSEKRVNIYSVYLLAELKKSLSKKDCQIIGIPLQTMMVADIFGDREGDGQCQGCKQFCESEQETRPQINGLKYQLYQKFCEKKFEIFFKEKQQLNTAMARMELPEKRKKLFITHQNLALHSLLTSEEFKSVCPECNIDEQMAKVSSVGLTDKFSNRNFIYDTFAEYFAARKFAEVLETEIFSQEMKNMVLEKILIKGNFKVVRTFINGNFEMKFEKLPPSNVLKDWNMSCGNKLFKLSLTEKHYCITGALLENIKNESNFSILALKVITNRNVMKYYIFQKHKGILEILKENDIDLFNTLTSLFSCKKREGESNVLNSYFDLNIVNRDSFLKYFFNFLHYSRQRIGERDKIFFMEISREIADNSEDEHCKKKHHHGFLEYYSFYGNIKFVKWMVNGTEEEGRNFHVVNCRDSNGLSLLHHAVKENDITMLNWALRHAGKIYFNRCKDKFGRIILHYAAAYADLPIVEKIRGLKHSGMTTNDVSGNGMFHYAAMNDNEEIFFFLLKYLLFKSKVEIYKTMVIRCILLGDLDSLKKIEKFVPRQDITQFRTVVSEMLIEWNVSEKRNDISEYFANNNQLTTLGNPPAIENESSLPASTVQEDFNSYESFLTSLSRPGVDWTEVRDGSAGGLHYAAKSPDVKVFMWFVQKLSEAGSDSKLQEHLNHRDENGETPLMWAVRNIPRENLCSDRQKSLKILSLILKIGSKPTIQNDDHKTALRLAAQINPGIVCFLLRESFGKYLV